MQSIDVMRRKEAFPGFYFSAEPSQLLTTSPIRILELYFSLKTARRVVEQLWKNGLAKPPKLFVDDYIGQTSVYSPPAELGMDPLLPNMVAQAQIDYVGQIAELCRHHGTECVYAYGPIYDGILHPGRGLCGESGIGSRRNRTSDRRRHTAVHS